MGTLTIIAYRNKYQIAQYGRWGGYPENAGKDILCFLGKAGNVKALKEALDSGKVVYRDDAFLDSLKGVSNDEMYAKHPDLCRDMGTGVLSHLIKAKSPEHYSQLDFAADGLSCEYAYVIDLDRQVLEVHTNRRATRHEPLAEGDRFFFLNGKAKIFSGGTYYPVRMVCCLPFRSIRERSLTGMVQEMVEACKDEA